MGIWRCTINCKFNKMFRISIWKTECKHCSIALFFTRRSISLKNNTILTEVLNQVIKIVNFTRTRAIKFIIFYLQCKDMDTQLHHLSLHTNIRWLSKGKVLSSVSKLQKDLCFYQNEKYDRFYDYLNNELLMSEVEYLTEIFEHLNSLTMRG